MLQCLHQALKAAASIRRRPKRGRSENGPAKVVAFYAANPGEISGQLIANRLAIQAIQGAGIEVGVIELPGLRTNEAGVALRNLIRLLRGWTQLVECAWQPPSMVFVGSGQSWASFAREMLPVLLLSTIRPTLPLAVTLHGNIFTQWSPPSLIRLLYAKSLSRARVITCLGPRQRQHLLSWGLRQDVVRVVNNGVDVPPLEEEAIRQKWKEFPLKLLFLSNLIEEKGYLVFLRALARLATFDGPPVEAVVCGRFTQSSSGGAKSDSRPVALESLLREINESRRVQVSWIQGAYGEEKVKLFREAHVFVFPSSYSVEAQPLVLIEAMSNGCAVVTTAVGEIASMFTPNGAFFLDSPPDPVELSGVLERILAHPEGAMDMGLRARRHQASEFSLERFAEEWRNIANELVCSTSLPRVA